MPQCTIIVRDGSPYQRFIGQSNQTHNDATMACCPGEGETVHLCSCHELDTCIFEKGA